MAKKLTVAGYEWRPGRGFTCPAPVAHNTIQMIRQRDGACTPAALVEWSRPESSPLHDDIFDCEPDEAAERYWENNARTVINHLMVVYKHEVSAKPKAPTRAFVSLRTVGGSTEDGPNGEPQTSGYTDVETVMSDPTLRRRYIVSALREIASWRRKHQDIVELARLFEAIDPVLVEYGVAEATLATAAA